MDEAERAIASAKELIEILKDYLYEDNDWLNEGKALSANKEVAIKYLNKAIDKNQSNAETYFHLANVYSLHNEFDLAIKYYEKALEFGQWPDCYYNLGRVYQIQEKYDKALFYFDKAIDLKYEVSHPHTNPYYQKFMILTREGLNSYELDKIIELLKIPFEIFPNHTEFPYNLAVTYDLKNESNNAIFYMDKLIQLSPSNIDHYLQRAEYELKIGVFDKAIDDIERAVKIDGRLKEPIKKHPKFDVLKNNERFNSILKN